MTGIVIPTYNEADNIPTLFEGLAPVGAQIIIVDDGSTDGRQRSPPQRAQRSSSAGVSKA